VGDGRNLGIAPICFPILAFDLVEVCDSAHKFFVMKGWVLQVQQNFAKIPSLGTCWHNFLRRVWRELVANCFSGTDRMDNFLKDHNDSAYKFRKKTGASDAAAATACNPRTNSVCFGARGIHLVAKKARTGIWPAISNCQICAAVPSSASRVIP
jgi:hypothetical protein